MLDQAAVDVPRIDKVGIASMKQADRVVFRHANGQSRIECIKEAKRTPRDPFASEQVIILPCLFDVCDFGGNGTEEYPSPARVLDWQACREGRFTAFDMEHSPQSSPEWQTLIRLMRPDDTLILRWERNAGTNPAICKRGVGVDRLFLIIRREGKPDMVFLLNAVGRTFDHHMVNPT